MLPYLLVFVSILACSVKNLFVKLESPLARGRRRIFAENTVLAVAAALLMGIWLGFRVQFTPSVLLFGAMFGLLMILFFLFYTLAVESGPLSLTSLISSLGFLICSFFGSIYGKQAIPPLRYAGVAVIVLSLFICLEKEDGAKHFSWKWFFCSFATLVIAGGFGIIQFLFNEENGGTLNPDMLFVAFALMAVVSGLLFLLFGKSAPAEADFFPRGRFLLYAAIIGMMCCLQNLMNLYTVGQLPSMVTFPISNCGPVVLTALLSFIFLGEKISPRKIIGMVICFAGMLMVGLA